MWTASSTSSFTTNLPRFPRQSHDVPVNMSIGVPVIGNEKCLTKRRIDIRHHSLAFTRFSIVLSILEASHHSLRPTHSSVLESWTFTISSQAKKKGLAQVHTHVVSTNGLVRRIDVFKFPTFRRSIPNPIGKWLRGFSPRDRIGIGDETADLVSAMGSLWVYGNTYATRMEEASERMRKMFAINIEMYLQCINSLQILWSLACFNKTW